MSKGLRVTLLTIGGIVAVAALLLLGMNIGRPAAFSSDAWSGGFSVLRTDLDHPCRRPTTAWPAQESLFGNSMIAPGRLGAGFMGHAQADLPYGIGMMVAFGGQALLGTEPIEAGEARAAVQSYIEGLGLGGFGMMGMIGGINFSTEEAMLELMREPADAVDFGELLLGPQEAVEAAQRYLDVYLPGAEADDTPDPFYGYYTLHIERDGNVVGMLSVNGTTGQV